MASSQILVKILVRPAWLSFVAAVVSVLLIIVPLDAAKGIAVVLPGVGIAMALQGLKIIRTDPETYRGSGYAIAGIVINGLLLLLYVAVLALTSTACAALLAQG